MSGASAGWRCAARLARREVRRRPGRTALVAVLVALPVLAMAAASTTYRTLDEPWARTFERRAGQADLVVDDWRSASTRSGVEAATGGGPPDRRTDWRELVPAGARVVEVMRVTSQLVPADGPADPELWVHFTDLPLTDPLTQGIVQLRSGRAPTGPDEVLLDPTTARRLGVGLGDALALARPSGTWRVVGIGRTSDDHAQPLLVVGSFDRARLRPDGGSSLQALVEMAPGSTDADVTAAEARFEAEGWDAWDRLVDPATAWADPGAGRVQTLAWGWVAGTLALAAVGIVIASAFAASARRQLVTIGQLSSNGASHQLVRRSLALQGTWTGTLGAAVGVAGGLVSVVVARPLIERTLGHSVPPLQFTPLDLVVIAATGVVAATVAAAVPARSAARTPVLSALAGRRPMGPAPRRLVPTGLALFTGGTFLLALAATASGDGRGDTQLFAAAAVLGGLGVVFGMCCCTPLVIDLVGRSGGRVTGTWRLAARSTARVRTRSAGIVTAIATTAACAVVGVTVVTATVRDEVDFTSLPRDAVVVRSYGATTHDLATGLEQVEVPAGFTPRPGLVDGIEAALPDATWTPLRAAVFDQVPYDPTRAVMVEDDQATWIGPEVALVADSSVLDLLDLPAADRDLLARADVLEMSWRPPAGDEPTTAVLHAVGGDLDLSVAYASRPVPGSFQRLISPERAEALGLQVVELGAVVRAGHDLSAGERNAVQSAGWPLHQVGAFTEPGDPEPAAEEVGGGTSIEVAWSQSRISTALVHGLIIGAAGLLTLLVVAIGLSLSAAEGRDERDVLVAVGARPRTLSRLAGAKAVVLAGTGVLLAVPTGALPIWVVFRATGDPVQPPVLALAALVLVVPALAGAGAWSTSSLVRRVRPVVLSAHHDS